MRNRIILSMLFTLACFAAASAQVQTIQPGDSLEARRQKENSSLQYLNSRYSSLNQLAHTHGNKTVIDTIPALFGMGNRLLGSNANGTSFEFKSLVAGAGITISHGVGQTTISLVGGGGITSLNGLTPSSQTFANDSNVSIVSSGSVHQVTWSGLLAASRGGTNNGFFQVSGPAGSPKTYNIANQNAKILTDAAPVLPAEGGLGAANLSGILKGNGASPATAVAAPSGAIVGTTDPQTISGKVYADPAFTGFAEFRSGAEGRFYNAAGTFYAGFKAAPSLAANKIWDLPVVDGSSSQVLTTDGSGHLSWTTQLGSGVGEANTASNVGNAGFGLFKQKLSADLQFRNVAAGSNKVAVALDAPNNNVAIDVNESNLNVANMGGTLPVSKGGTGAGALTGLIVGNGTGAFTTKPSPSGNVVGDSDPATLTQKLIDCRAAGNTCITESKIWIDAAGADGTGASSNWDLPASNAPTAAAVVGTNVIKGVLDFDDGATDLTAQRTVALPGDFTGAVDVTLKWFSPVTTGTAVLGVATACAGDGSLDDPAFNSFSDVADQAKASANQINDAVLTNVNTTGCSGGKLMHVKIARRLSQSADTLFGKVRLIGLEITFQRAQ